jgi:ATP-dependent helicase/nuclease subunit A
MSYFTVYKSSAGSGKTFTLVKDYLKIALNDSEYPPKKYRTILAITFTNKAASEMKSRILSALKSLSIFPFNNKAETLAGLLMDELNIDEKTLSKRSEQLFNHILHNYGNFSINTIDSFTHSVIRSFSFDMNLPVNFNIELNENEIIAKCVDKLVAAIGERDDITELILEYSKSQSEQQKNWQVDKVIKEFVIKAFKDPSSKKLDLLKQFSISDFKEIKNELIQLKINFEKRLESAADDFYKILNDNQIEINDFYQGANGLPIFFKRLKTKEYVDKDPIRNYTIQTIYEDKWVGGKTNKFKEQLILSLKDDFKKIFFECEKILSNERSDYLITCNLLNNIYSISLINEVKKIIEDFKKQENILFISEFNEKISEVVINEPVPYIYEKIGERYNHFLVDEFQDTSVLQWQNLLPLIDNSLSEGHYNLVVGDGKQSIYRWRGGIAEQFNALPYLPTITDTPLKNSWENNLVNYSSVKELKKNFRSHVNIVEFNNRFFSFVSSKLDDEQIRIYENAEQTPLDSLHGGLVTIDMIENYTESFNPFSRTLQLIQNSLLSNYNYSDITILVRSKQNGIDITKFLNEKNIPVISSEALLLNNCDEIKFIIHVLHFIADIDPAIHASSILIYLSTHSIINDKSIDELLLSFNHSNYQLKEFKTILSGYDIQFDIQKLLLMPLLECCIEIISTFKLNNNKHYIQFFLDEIILFSNQNTISIYLFLEYWEQKKNKSSLKISDDINAVKVMTIHKSKGLEFPVVIIPFCDWKTYYPDTIWVEDKNDKLPFMVLNMKENLNDTDFSNDFETEKNRQILDNINLLYVAFTRASQHLHIISEKSSNEAKNVYSLISLFEQEKYVTEDYGKSLKIGEELTNNKKIKSNENFIFQFQVGNWNRAIDIKKSNDFILDEETISKKETGIIIHHLLSKIKNASEIEKVLDEFIKEGYVNENLSNEIKEQLIALISHPDVSCFFDITKKVINERELLSSSGNVIRPDRIIISENNSVDIIDFKSGLKSDTHKKQVVEYENVIKELGFNNIKKYLVYLQPIEVVYVN